MDDLRIWVVETKTRRARIWSPWEAFRFLRDAESRRRELASKWPHLQIKVSLFKRIADALEAKKEQK